MTIQEINKIYEQYGIKEYKFDLEEKEYWNVLNVPYIGYENNEEGKKYRKFFLNFLKYF